jgi:hypothetical protein
LFLPKDEDEHFSEKFPAEMEIHQIDPWMPLVSQVFQWLEAAVRMRWCDVSVGSSLR